MDSKTVQYKRTLRGSVGAGVGALFNGNGRRYYILEHKSASKYHRAGESQKIIIDQAEMGRDAKCQVRFDGETFPTVSRRHAAIVKDGEGWKIVHLSTTNSTLVNGQRVETERPLQNGDEIQLSVGGPRMGFIVPAGKQGLVSSIKLSSRIRLIQQQALRPYKTAIMALTVCLIIAVVGLGGWNLKLNDELKSNSKETAKQLAMIDSLGDNDRKSQRTIDSLTYELLKTNKKLGDIKVHSYRGQIKPFRIGKDITHKSTGAFTKIEDCFPYTYYVECYLLDENDNLVAGDEMDSNGKPTPIGWRGTGFLLSNGYFVTAEHMVNYDDLGTKIVEENGKRKRFIDFDSNVTKANAMFYLNKFKILLIAQSSSGDKPIILKYTNNSNPFRTGKSFLSRDVLSDSQGRSWVLGSHDYQGNDWACVKVNRPGGIPFDAKFSMNMPAQTHLSILGFPARMDTKQEGRIAPDVSEAVTSRSGREDAGWIRTSNANTDHGNSGGPVITDRNGKKVVVGILSGSRFGSDASRRKGAVIPIGAAFN